METRLGYPTRSLSEVSKSECAMTGGLNEQWLNLIPSTPLLTSPLSSIPSLTRPLSLSLSYLHNIAGEEDLLKVM